MNQSQELATYYCTGLITSHSYHQDYKMKFVWICDGVLYLSSIRVQKSNYTQSWMFGPYSVNHIAGPTCTQKLYEELDGELKPSSR
jgi:hypothetical protein